MGRIRGKRNRDQDRYWHERRKATQAGMVGASDVALCLNCGLVSPASSMFKGWCEPCMERWRATADPVMLAQAAAGYAPPACLPAPSDRDVQRILDFIVTPKDDKEYRTLLLYFGGGSIGRMQALWNFCKTMEVMEMKTTGEVMRLTKASHDLVHRCGLHAPVQKSSLDSFFGRVFNSGDFKPFERDKHLGEYMRWFADANKFWLFPLRRISEVAEWKTRRNWRRMPRVTTPLTVHWPFLHKEAAKDHLDIMLVDSLVPKGIPEQWRQDMCQDLFVAVLSGEIEPDRLQVDARHYIEQVWRSHPYKYGHLSLDAPVGRHGESGKTYKLSDIIPDISIDPVDHSLSVCCVDHHEPKGIGTMGDVLRAKNNGVAIPDLRMEHPEEMDAEIADVYISEVARGRSGYDLQHTRVTEAEAANIRGGRTNSKFAR